MQYYKSVPSRSNALAAACCLAMLLCCSGSSSARLSYSFSPIGGQLRLVKEIPRQQRPIEPDYVALPVMSQFSAERLMSEAAEFAPLRPRSPFERFIRNCDFRQIEDRRALSTGSGLLPSQSIFAQCSADAWAQWSSSGPGRLKLIGRPNWTAISKAKDVKRRRSELDN